MVNNVRCENSYAHLFRVLSRLLTDINIKRKNGGEFRLSLFVHDENLSYITLVNSSNTYNTNWMEWVDQFCIFRSVVDRG